MKTSEQIDQIGLCLSMVIGEVTDARKEQQGYGYTYADLHQVLQIIRPLLAKHQLGMVQFPATVCEDGGEKGEVITRLMHKDQWMESALRMPISSNGKTSGEQDVGKTISYARRYALTSIFAISQVDSDGESLTQPQTKQKKEKNDAVKPPPDFAQNKPKPKPTKKDQVIASVESLAFEKKVKLDKALADREVSDLSELSDEALADMHLNLTKYEGKKNGVS